MSTTNIELLTWLDRLPTEVIFLLFNYLSNNDIIYAFYNFNQRFNSLLLQSKQHYLTHLELPATNLDKWESILSEISFGLESIHINTVDLSLRLNTFINIKSIIISLPFNYPTDALNIIVESSQFQNLHSFKIKEHEHFSERVCEVDSIHHDYIFKKIFYEKNSLQIFQCSLMISSNIFINTSYLETNFNLRTLKLILNDFGDIFIFIQYTPNVEYLDVQAKSSNRPYRPVNGNNIKLKKFYLTMGLKQQTQFQTSFTPMGINQIVGGIKQFSSSLIYLSLDLVGMDVGTTNEIPFNSLKLEQFLTKMINLKDFHLCARLPESLNDNEYILSEFKNQYWYDCNCTFGMHGRYFYTLPYHFDYLYEFYQDFNTVKSNNPNILRLNTRIWYSVRYIQLLGSNKYNKKFFKELEIKMPRLKWIEFDDSSMLSQHLRIVPFGIKEIDFKLNSVSSIELFSGSIEDRKEWLINALPNLKRLVLSSVDLHLTNNRLAEILNKKIQYLHITSDIYLQELIDKSYVYFSNIQYISINLSFAPFGSSELCAKFVMKILTNFQNLRTLAVYVLSTSRYMTEPELYVLMQYLDIDHISKTYQIKYLEQYSLFIKKRF